MQSYTTVPMNIRRLAKMLYAWHLKKRGDWDMIHEENYIIETLEEVASARKKLRQGKHTCLFMRTKHLRAYEIVSEQNHYETMVLLPRHHSTPTELLQNSCCAPMELLLHFYRTAAVLLQESYSTSAGCSSAK